MTKKYAADFVSNLLMTGLYTAKLVQRLQNSEKYYLGIMNIKEENF